MLAPVTKGGLVGAKIDDQNRRSRRVHRDRPKAGYLWENLRIQHLFGGLAVTILVPIVSRARIVLTVHALARATSRARALVKPCMAGLGGRIVGLPETRPFEPLTDDTLMNTPPAAIGHAVHDLLGHIEDGRSRLVRITAIPVPPLLIFLNVVCPSLFRHWLTRMSMGPMSFVTRARRTPLA